MKVLQNWIQIESVHFQRLLLLKYKDITLAVITFSKWWVCIQRGSLQEASHPGTAGACARIMAPLKGYKECTHPSDELPDSQLGVSENTHSSPKTWTARDKAVSRSDIEGSASLRGGPAILPRAHLDHSSRSEPFSYLPCPLP